MITILPHDLRAPNGQILLSNFSFHISVGEHVAIMGPNGCGKSTLLRQIVNIEPQRNSSAFQITEERISYIPTRPLDLILPWATVEENISIFSLMSRRNQDRVRHDAKFFAKLMMIDIESFLKKKVFKLSSGMQAMASIFCAFIQSPTLLIADEIFSTLAESPRNRIALWLKEKPITMVCVSHDSNFIDTLQARIVQLDSFIPNGGN